MTLISAKTNIEYIITKVEGFESERRRLLDMGFTVNTKVFLLSGALGGGAVLVGIRGTQIALRSDAAKLIEIGALNLNGI